MKHRAAVILLLVLTPACSDHATSLVEPVVPQHRTLKVRWATPHTTDAAVRLTIRGPDVADVTAVRPDYMAFSRAVEGGLTVIVFGELVSGDLVSFAVQDGLSIGLYTLKLEQVAGTTDELRPDLEDYRLDIVPAASR